MVKKIVNWFKNRKTYEYLLLFLIPIVIVIRQGWLIGIDSWYIFRVGEYILKSGFPKYDFLTIHEGLKYVPQQWGFAVIEWTVFKHLGAKGLFALGSIMILLLTYSIYKLCDLVSEGNKKISIIVTTLEMTCLGICQFLYLRPQLFSYIFLTWTLYVLEKYRRTNNFKLFIFLIILSILQINIHASLWWFLIVFILPFVAEQFIDQVILKKKNGRDIRMLVLVLLATFMVGLINPYGVDAITYLFKSYNPYTADFIGEMHLFSTFSGRGFCILTYLITYFLFLLFDKKREFKSSYFFMLFGCFLLAFANMKSTVFFFLGCSYPLANIFKNYLSRKDKVKFMDTKLIYKVCYALVLIVVLGGFGFLYRKRFYIESVSILSKELDALKEEIGTDGVRLYTSYNQGSYAEYIGFRCVIDTRAELFYETINEKEAIFDKYYLVQHGEYDINKFLFDYDITHIFINRKDYLYDHFNNDDYHLIMKGPDFKAYERNDFRSEEDLG